jgi:hypothetical protein
MNGKVVALIIKSKNFSELCSHLYNRLLVIVDKLM